jgi:CHAD domain-containing protein
VRYTSLGTVIDMHGANNNTKKSRLIVLDGAFDSRALSEPPPHLSAISWIDHESRTAQAAFMDMDRDLKKLKKKVSPDRVHKARVTLRRWSAVWALLGRDGWETDKYAKEVGRPLVKLQKLLGEVRDLDVNMEQGQRLGCTEELIQSWAKDRAKAQKRLETFVADQDIEKILKRLSAHLCKRAPKVRTRLPRAKSEQSAFDHIELFLLEQESITREQAATAKTPEELHELRLSIKRWRYLLAEFFMVTNLELVRAQQILGQIHDLDRLTPILESDETQAGALPKLKARRKELLHDLESMRKRLPYGLRPEITSLKPAVRAGLHR